MKFTIELNAQEAKEAATGGLISAIASLKSSEPDLVERGPGMPNPETMPPAPPIRHTAPAPQPFPQQPEAPVQGVPLQQPIDPATQQAMQQPAPVEQPVPTQAPQEPMQQPQQPAVPTQTATYTQEQLALAASQLMEAKKDQSVVINLLGKYGAQALTQLPKEQYGAFATDLRALGAKI